MNKETKIIEIAEDAVHNKIEDFLNAYKMLAGSQVTSEEMQSLEDMMKNLERDIIDEIREGVDNEFA